LPISSVKYNRIETMSKHPQKLERLDEITRSLSSAPEVDAFLQTLTDAAAELTASEAACILHYRLFSDQLDFVAVPFAHRDILLGASLQLQATAAGWAFQHARPLSLNQSSGDARYFHDIDQTGIMVRSVLAVPLMFRGGPMGAIEVVNKTDEAHYTDEDILVLETLASLASAALRERDLQQRVDAASGDAAALDRLKSDFIAITSHELRTPLGLILGHATFLRELAGEDLHEQLDVIIRHATRLKEIVENLSSVNNYEIGAARVREHLVSMTQMVREVTESFQDEARRENIRLKTQVGADPLAVRAEAGKISLALANLIKNALTFTNAGGEVVVSAETATPGFVKVSIADTGIGIPAEDAARIFERFFQVESHLTRKHGGMGLGLSVAKAMIEMHGGRIAVESVEGKGTTVSFLLPMESAATKAFS